MDAVASPANQGVTNESKHRRGRLCFIISLLGAAVVIFAVSSIETYYRQPIGEFWRPNVWRSIALAGGLALYFAGALRGRARAAVISSGDGARQPPPRRARRRSARSLLGGALLIAAAALFAILLLDTWRTPVGLDGPAYLFGGLACLIVGAAMLERRRRSWARDFGLRGRPHASFLRGDAPWLILVVALWAAVQIPRLDTRPGYFHGDEATVIIHGRNAYRPNPIGDALDRPMRVRAVEAPWRTVYHPFLTCIPRAYFHYLFPERPYFGSRLYGAIVGSLSVVALFLFTRAGFGRATAWTAALFYASSHLILRYSRSGFTNLDAIVLLGFWGLAFLGAWRSRRVSLALAAGALAGLSYYFYYGALLAIPLTFGLWIFFFATRPRRAIRRRSLALAMAIGFALAAAPNALFNAKWRPSDTRWHRNSVTVFQPSNVEAIRRAVGGEGAIDTMIRYAWPSIGGALLWSNGNFQADYGSGRRPTLNRLLAGLLLLGLVGAAARGRPRRTLAIVVAWWALAIVFGSLLTYGAPYAPRLVTMVAAACILGAWALVDLVRRARGTFGAMAAWMAAGPAVALAAVIAIGDARHYYFDYIEDFENVGYSRTPVGMMAFMKDFPADAKLVLFAPWEFQINTSNMALFDTGFPREIFTDRDSLDAPPPPHPRLATAYAIKLPEFSRVDSAMAARDDIDEVVEIANPYRPSMHPTHRVYWIRPPSP